jgi:ABC-type dipeptide/oligopeptide/nickel transport system permease subunit
LTPSAPTSGYSGRVRSLGRDALGRLLRNRLSLIGLTITLLFVLLAILGPVLAPYPYQQQDLRRTNELPSQDHWLGTDDLGRDCLSRVMWGARTAIIVATFVTSIAVTLGILLGGVAAYLGGLADSIVGRLVDVAQSVPTIMLALLVDTAVKRPVANAFELAYQATGLEFFRGSILLDYLITLAAIAAVSWPAYARLIRGQILSIRVRGYVEAARATGVPGGRILLRHIVPNALGPIIVAATFGFSSAMILEASLSYLGIGIQPPAASWGAMINDNLHQWRNRPYLVAVPAVVLGIATLAINFLGDGLNDALNPRVSVARKN